MNRTKLTKMVGPVEFSEPTRRRVRRRNELPAGIADFDLDFIFPLPNFMVGQQAAVDGWVSCLGVALSAWLVDGSVNRTDLPNPTYDDPPPDPPTWTLQFTPNLAGTFLLTVQGQKGSPPGTVETVSVTVSIAVVGAAANKRSNHRATRTSKNGGA